MKCLWLSRYLPYPIIAGDRNYTAHLANSLADAGADVTFVGLNENDFAAIPTNSRLKWHIVEGGTRPRPLALISSMPLVAASYQTRAYRKALVGLMQDEWDVIVLDQYALGWALEVLGPRRSILVHVAHDHEESVTGSIAESGGLPLPKRLFLKINHFKTARLERRITRTVDLVTCITGEDKKLFDAQGARNTVVLIPGYSGPRVAQRTISVNTPRQVAIMGSFQWIAKQENLKIVLSALDPIFAQAGIRLIVGGSVSVELRKQLAPTLNATTFHGYVEDGRAFFDRSRLALLAEPIGGGFKLKLLDYIFHRAPVAALDRNLTGLPSPLRACVVSSDSLCSLGRGIVEIIDNIDKLNSLQNAAYEIAMPLFDWKDRGRSFLTAIEQLAASLQKI
jgi:polysaccharide biosynthesis protein PslH